MSNEQRPMIIVAARHAGPGSEALAAGVVLARLLGADIVLTGVYVAPLGPGGSRYDLLVRDEVRGELEALAQTAPSGVQVHTRVVGATSVVRGLHESAEALDAVLLVVGQSRLGRATRVLRGDVALQAVHAAPCAVLVAPADDAGRTLASDHQLQIAVAYDASAEAAGALQAAVELARAGDGRLHIVSVLDQPYVLVSPPDVDAAGQSHHLHERLGDVRALLAAAEASVPDDVPVTTSLVEGSAAVELAHAGDDTDLLVMGSRAYGPIRRVLMGSVAAGVMDGVRCPVLILPRGVPLAGPRSRHASAAAAGTPAR
jgi:nucleotide-binding universal stress UspA family protein